MMRNMLLAILALALVIPGCAERGASKEGEHAPAKAGKAAEAAGDVIATLGDATITMQNFQTEVEKLPPQHRQWTSTPQGRKYIVDNLVEGYLIDDEAKKRGIDKRPDLAAKLDGYRRQLNKDSIMEEILRNEAAVPDAEIQRYYNEHPVEFKQPERVKVFDMVLQQEDTARGAIAKLKAGADFGALAKELSVDAYTRDRGGELPEFSKPMRPEIYDAAAAAKKPGQIIGPLKTSQGFHVMKFVKLLPAEEKTFEQVRESLKSRLQAMKRQETYVNFIKGLRESAKLAINEDFINPKKGGSQPPASARPAPVPPKGK